MRKAFGASIKITMALMLSLFTSNFLPVMTAYATTNNTNGQGADTCPNTTFTELLGGWVKTDGLTSTTFDIPEKTGYTVTDVCYKASNEVVYPEPITDPVVSTVYNHPEGHPGRNLQNLSHASIYYTKDASVAVVAAVFTEPTCDAPGTLTGINTAQYSWVRTGLDTAAVLTATPVGNVTLTGELVFGPYDLTQLTGDECDTPLLPATAGSVSQLNPCDAINDKLIIPSTDNVTYSIGGVTIEAGTHLASTLASQSGTVVATADTGYALTAPYEFNYSFTNEGCVLGDSTEVTLCHATASAKNPYVRITVSAAGAYNGHYGDKANHQDSEDIIPEFWYNGVKYSQNWDTEGQAIYNSEDCGTIGPKPCPVPTNGGVITQNTAGWGTYGDVEFVDGGVTLASNGWSAAYVYSEEDYNLSEFLTPDWGVDESGVSGAYGIAIIIETEDGEFIHYEPFYSNDYWSDYPVLPLGGGGQGGDYSGTLQDALDTIGDVKIVNTYFYFTSQTANEILLTDLSFNCTTYTFDEVTEVTPITVKPVNPTYNDICALVNDTISAPLDTDSIDYTLTWNGQVATVTAVAKEGYTLDVSGTAYVLGENSVATWTYTFTNVPCGNILGDSTKVPSGGMGAGQILGTALPAQLPATGPVESSINFLYAILAAVAAYGATYFLQGKRDLDQA